MNSHWAGVDDTPASLDALRTHQSPPVHSDSAVYFLTSARMGFRTWTAADASLAINLWCDPQVTALIGGPWSREQALARLSQEIEQQNQVRMQYWPIFSLKDGCHAGCAGLRPYQPRQAVYEMGIHLLPKFWGQALGVEIANTLISYAFGSLGASAVFCGHHPANNASRQLLQKLGFAGDGDRLYLPTGLMHPTYLLRRDTSATSQTKDP